MLQVVALARVAFFLIYDLFLFVVLLVVRDKIGDHSEILAFFVDFILHICYFFFI